MKPYHHEQNWEAPSLDWIEALFARKSEGPEPDDDFYFEVDLEPALYAILLAWVRNEKAPGKAVRGKLEGALLDARRMDGELIRAHFDWTLASERGCSESDLIWDGAKPKEDDKGYGGYG